MPCQSYETAYYVDPTQKQIADKLAEARAQLFVLSVWYYGLPYYVAAWMTIY